MDKETRNYKNKAYTFKYRTMNPMASPEWFRRGYAFVGQTQEHLKNILKELTLKMRTVTDKEIERDLKKGLKVTGDITSELSRFVRQGLEQKKNVQRPSWDTHRNKKFGTHQSNTRSNRRIEEKEPFKSFTLPHSKRSIKRTAKDTSHDPH